MKETKKTPAPKNPGPLQGIKVLDLTAVVLGPLATQVLADFGAEVIKIEPPQGDLMRANGISKSTGMSSTFMNINRNKKSVVLDLKTKKGKEIFFELAKQVDVLVHNMRVQAINRLGIGYEAISTINPAIIYCAATGYEEKGPMAGKPTFDDIIQGACGLADLIGHETGTPNYPPTLLADKVAGISTANAILGALVHQSRTGEGQYVEVPMFETMVAFTMTEHLGGKGFSPAIGPAGYSRLLKGGRKPCETQDGFIALLPYTEKHWHAFFSFFGKKNIIEKYDLSDRHQRNKNIHNLYDELRYITKKHTTEYLVQVCSDMDIPCSTIYSIESIDTHPQLKKTELFQTKKHSTEGDIIVVRPTALFSKTPLSIYKEAPNLGADTGDVIKALKAQNSL